MSWLAHSHPNRNSTIVAVQANTQENIIVLLICRRTFGADELNAAHRLLAAFVHGSESEGLV
jgi:hypothetical protein